MVRSDDLIGLEGVVTLEMDAENRGFVELSVRGTLLRRLFFFQFFQILGQFQHTHFKLKNCRKKKNVKKL